MKPMIFVALSFLFFSSSALARNCTRAEKADGDRWAWLSKRDHEGSIARNLPWGLPIPTGQTTNERLVVLTEYVNQFDDDLLIPLWSAERLAAARLDTVKSRINCFRAHPKVTPESDLDDDYDEKTFDQGHLTPSDDQSTSVRAMVNTYFYTNMVPQFGRFNRVTWRQLEAVVHDWAKPGRTLYVISGSIMDRDADGLRDQDSLAPRVQPRHGRPARVGIPSAFYKIIAYRQPDGKIATLSIGLPHDKAQLTGRALGAHYEQHVTTIADLESRTDLKFLPDASDIVEGTSFCAFADGGGANLCGE